jgi:hypothetical protein
MILGILIWVHKRCLLNVSLFGELVVPFGAKKTDISWSAAGKWLYIVILQEGQLSKSLNGVYTESIDFQKGQ